MFVVDLSRGVPGALGRTGSFDSSPFVFHLTSIIPEPDNELMSEALLRLVCI
jgi:hypothetical protein